MPSIAVLVHHAFGSGGAVASRAGAIESAMLDLNETWDTWSDQEAALAAILTTSLCVVDGHSGPAAQQTLDLCQGKLEVPPPWLTPFWAFWDATRAAITSVRPVVEGEQTLRDGIRDAARRALNTLATCRSMRFDFQDGMRFKSRVFPPSGGEFDWIEPVLSRTDGGPADVSAVTTNFQRLRSLDPTAFFHRVCRDYRIGDIRDPARGLLISRMLELKNAGLEWYKLTLAADPLQKEEAQRYRELLVKLRRELDAQRGAITDADRGALIATGARKLYERTLHHLGGLS